MGGGLARGKRLVLFFLGELGALDARGANRFQAQLLLVGLLDPSWQIRHLLQNAGGGLGLDQQPGYGHDIVAQPLLGNGVAADVSGGHFKFISRLFPTFSHKIIHFPLIHFKFISGSCRVTTGDYTQSLPRLLLGLGEDAVATVARLRRLLTSDPSIHGSKKPALPV